MKKFLLFLYEVDGVGGGWLDFENDFDTIEEARARAKKSMMPDYNIVDWEKRKIVEQGYCYILRGEQGGNK